MTLRNNDETDEADSWSAVEIEFNNASFSSLNAEVVIMASCASTAGGDANTVYIDALGVTQ